MAPARRGPIGWGIQEEVQQGEGYGGGMWVRIWTLWEKEGDIIMWECIGKIIRVSIYVDRVQVATLSCFNEEQATE